jgi:O-antigen/teichoic acid export membrane protein
MSWQEVVIREYKNEGADKFFRESADMLYKFVLSAITVIIPLIYLVMPNMISSTYKNSMMFAPVLLCSSGLSALSGFYGQLYAANEKTIGAMKTTIFGVVSNLSVVIILIKPLGLWAAALGSVTSNLAMVIARHLTFRKELGLKINLKMCVGFGVLIGFCLAAYYAAPSWVNGILLAMMLAVAGILNFPLLRDLAMVVFGKTKSGLRGM